MKSIPRNETLPQMQNFEGQVFRLSKIDDREYFCIQILEKHVFVYKQSREYFCSSDLYKTEYIKKVKEAIQKKNYIQKYYKVVYHIKPLQSGGATIERLYKEFPSKPNKSTINTFTLHNIDDISAFAAMPHHTEIQRKFFLQAFNFSLQKVENLIDDLRLCVDAEILLFSKYYHILPEVPKSVLVVDEINNHFRLRLLLSSTVTENPKPPGLIVVGNGISYISKGRLKPEVYQKLIHKGILFSFEKTEKLLDVLNKQKHHFLIQKKTTRLPTEKLDVFGNIFVEEENEKLVVKCSIVYGNPIQATIFGDSVTEDSKVIPFRDAIQERKISNIVSTRLSMSVGQSYEFLLENAFDIMDKIRYIDQTSDLLFLSGNAVERFQSKKEIIPVIRIVNDDIEIDWGNTTEENVLQAWSQRSSFIRLHDNNYGEIPDDWMEKYGEIVHDLLSARRKSEGKKLPKYALFDLARLCEKLSSKPPELSALRLLLDDFSGIPDEEPPKDLQASLRPYQKIGYNWLSFLKKTEMGGILADDMGLGKTLQSITILEKKSLVIAPTSILGYWISEITKFRPSITCELYHGSTRELNLSKDVIVTSYAILRNDIDLLNQIDWSVIILDEAQAIKNPKSQTAVAAFSLRSKFKLTMSGTPIENRLDELWSQMNFLCPGLFLRRRDFLKKYAEPISRGDHDATKELRTRIRPFILRRMKTEVATELPKRTDTVLEVEFSEEEQNIYNAVRLSTQEKILSQMEGASFSIMSALESLLRLRQAACHSGLLPNQFSETSSKIEILMSKLEELINSGHKAIIFSQWTQFLDRIEPHIQKVGYSYLRLDGSTQNRQELVESFQSEDGPPIFLSSLRAGGTGLNLTQADHVFLMDPWWNPAVEDQAADRAHRIGQEKPVFVYRIIAKNTVEGKILELQKKKRKIAEIALMGTGSASSITKDELLQLLQ